MDDIGKEKPTDIDSTIEVPKSKKGEDINCEEYELVEEHHLIEVPHLPHEHVTGSIAAAHLGQAVNTISKVAMPVSFAVDAAYTGYAVYEDYENSTTRNTVEMVAKLAGGSAGSYGGAVGGAAIGTALFPGIGTVIGGVVGAISGGFGGSLTSSFVVKTIGDSFKYNIITKQCQICGKEFKIRKYRGQKDINICYDCWKHNSERVCKEHKEDSKRKEVDDEKK